jgi:hypothetical protein
LAGNGDGTFYAAGTAAVNLAATYVYEFLTADLNGDGRPDLIAEVNESDFFSNVSVFLNAGDSPPLSFVATSSASYITAVAPASIATLFGTFGLAPPSGASTLTLAGATVNVADSAGVTRPALLFYSSTTQINLEIPAGTAPGVAMVTVAAPGGPS